MAETGWMSYQGYTVNKWYARNPNPRLPCLSPYRQIEKKNGRNQSEKFNEVFYLFLLSLLVVGPKHNLGTLDRKEFGQFLFHSPRPHSWGNTLLNLLDPFLRLSPVENFIVKPWWTADLSPSSPHPLLPSSFSKTQGSSLPCSFLPRLSGKISSFGSSHSAVCSVSLFILIPPVSSFSNYCPHHRCSVLSVIGHSVYIGHR